MKFKLAGFVASLSIAVSVAALVPRTSAAPLAKHECCRCKAVIVLQTGHVYMGCPCSYTTGGEGCSLGAGALDCSTIGTCP
ncbi:MAG: hypothetical protein ACKVWV_18555 [Planctomycetota bacterium]